MVVRENILKLSKGLNSRIIGQPVLVERLVMALICNGNLLLEGYPGTAKTRAVKVLAQMLDVSFGRVQFTPDLLPSDITGTEVYHHDGSQEKLTFEPGPVFNNLVLADEVNRAPAKVQAALLEAMEERQITVAGNTYPLPELFMVLATQNPLEQEGTYPLPEAQVDRFLMKVGIEYSDDAGEQAIIRLARGEEKNPDPYIETVPQTAILDARSELQDIFVSDAIEQYIVALTMASRQPERISRDMAGWVAVGASPRASIALDKCGRCRAWLYGRTHVEPEDIRAVAKDVLRHRITPSYEALAEGIGSEDLIDDIFQQVAVP
jgi:MoxR-like ATPase